MQDFGSIENPAAISRKSMDVTSIPAAILVDEKFYNGTIKPVFGALGWKATLHVDPPEGGTVIGGVIENCRVGGLQVDQKVNPFKVRMVIDTLLESGAPDNPNEGLPGWIDLRRYPALAPETYKPGDVYQKREDWRTPSLMQEKRRLDSDIQRKKTEEVLDYAKYRADPEDAARLKEYTTHRLRVQSKDMIDVGKAVFERKGWVYSGEHYGDGSLIIQIVIDKENRVVPIAVVADVLVANNIDPGEPFQYAGEEDELDRDQDDSVPFDDMPKSLSEAEAEADRQAGEAVVAEEETQEGGILVLALEDPFRFSFSRGDGEPEVIVKLELGDNVIVVHCRRAQLFDFLRDTVLELSEMMDSMFDSIQLLPDPASEDTSLAKSEKKESVFVPDSQTER